MWIPGQLDGFLLYASLLYCLHAGLDMECVSPVAKGAMTDMTVAGSEACGKLIDF